MTTLQTMYAPQVNSPATVLMGALTAGTTQVDVLNAALLPEPPMLLVIGGNDPNAETVLMTARTGNTITIRRAVQGTARSWAAATEIARLFTAADLETVQRNILALDAGKLESITAAAVVTGEPGTPAAVELLEDGSTVTIKFTIPAGAAGGNGATFIPAVSGDGEISWTNDKGLENPASINIKGPPGAPGPNQISGETQTALTGLLKGNGAVVEQAQAGVDYQAANLTFTNTAVETALFMADTTYPDYGFRAAVPLANVTATMTPEVVFAPADALRGVFAPVAACYDGGVYLYAKEIPGAAVMIPTILIIK